MEACRCARTGQTTAHGCDDLFTNAQAVQLYKNHVKKVVTRVNTYNNITYRDDPTILGAGPPWPPTNQILPCSSPIQATPKGLEAL